MRIVKPSWISSKEPLFTCDVHPDGTKFATGGQGDGNGKITIWNVLPVKSNKSGTGQKEIAVLELHEGCVNCVRWSTDGRYLASAADDKSVMIWTAVRYEGSFRESYKCSHILRSHNGDVLDVAWSPKDQYIASTSIDNTVIIWDATDFPEKVTTIKGHAGMVKGVVWDPIGRYLATQSTDKTLRVWRTEDWTEEKVIKEPFRKCGGTTTVLRLGWSPDGQYIVSSHAMNNDGPVAKIIERDDWKARMDFVGHRRAIESVRFNPKLFFCDKNPVSCVAIAGRDSSISVWLTSLKRPLFVLHDVFTSSILDMSWTPDGYGLFVCSLDGSLVFLELNHKELGKPLSMQQVNSLKKATYGDLKPVNTTIIENPDFVDNDGKVSSSEESMDTEEDTFSKNGKVNGNHVALENDPFEKLATRPFGNSKQFTSSSQKQTSDIKEKQVESQTKDGRRRIMPVTLKVVDETPPAPTKKRLQLTSLNTVPSCKGVIAPNPASQIEMMGVPAKLSKRSRLSAPATAEETENVEKLFAIVSGTRFEIDNRRYLVHITKDSSTWTTAICSKVSTFSSDAKTLLLGCTDGSIHVLNQDGRHILPFFNIGSSIIKSALHENMIAIVTDVPSVYVWDVPKKKCLLKNESIASFITSSRSVIQININNLGHVTIGFSDGTACCYDYDLAAWMVLLRSDLDSLWYDDLRKNKKDQKGHDQLSNFHKMFFTAENSGSKSDGEERTMRTILMLEQQILVCKHLNSNSEGRQWLSSLIRFLVSKGDEARLKRFLQTLITSSETDYLGAPRSAILEETLKKVSTNINLQRLYMEFKQQADWLQNRK